MNIYRPAELRALLERHGLRLTKARGQNFLISPWVPEQLCDEAGLDEKTGVVEIGPGVGALTRTLAPLAGRVVCVELDYGLRPVLAETLADLDNVTVRFEDAVKCDFAALVDAELPGLRPVVCANLPYQVTSPLLGAVLESRRFETVTVMVQLEVARRMVAGPNTADYGAFSVFVQAHTQPRILFEVPPDCFWPQPKVTSAVVHMERLDRDLPPLFFPVVRAAFAQRRKTLLNALSAGLPQFDKARIAAAIEGCGLPPQVRGEVLDIPRFAALANLLTQ